MIPSKIDPDLLNTNACKGHPSVVSSSRSGRNKATYGSSKNALYLNALLTKTIPYPVSKKFLLQWLCLHLYGPNQTAETQLCPNITHTKETLQDDL